jgi:hypothetical protein
MTIRKLTFAALAACFAFAAGAQTGAAGKWNASVDTPQGAFPFTLDFAVAGDKLTGTLTSEFTGPVPILEGTTKGNDVAFKVKIEGQGGPAMTLVYKGTVKGDDLALVSTFEGAPPGGDGPAEMVAKGTRAK